MLVVRTTERPDLALAMNPFGLDGVQPQALLRQKATDDPYPTAALLDFSIVFAEPSSDLPGDVPACVVPDEKKGLLAKSFELLAAPREKPRGYGAHRPAVDEPYPYVVEPWKVEAVAGYGLRVGVGCLHQSVAPPFFRSYKGSGEVIHRLARCQRMPRRRESVARMVSTETLFSVRPSSKAASAAISRVHRLLSYPNSLGERWSIPRSRSAEFASKAGYTRFGVEEPAMSASKPFSLKARMALRTVWEAHPRLWAILGGELPRALASSIWDRRITKVSLERSPAWRLSRSFSDNSGTNIGGFMKGTIAHHTQPSLRMH